MRIYLDVCCLNRPFNDQTQDRIRTECAAIEQVFRSFEERQHTWVTSEAIDDELRGIRDTDLRSALFFLITQAEERLILNDSTKRAAHQLIGHGIDFKDALHLALAVRGNCDILLTVDDDFVRAAARLGREFPVRVENPVRWLKELERQ